MHVVASFTNFGPYHLARLRALGDALAARGGRLTAVETAGVERKYPWQTRRAEEPFAWATLFPGRALEEVSSAACRVAMVDRLEADRPDAVLVSGYVRPECLAAAAWARREMRPRVLMSESQAIDRPRAWWKEAVKARRVGRFQAALVGGPRHADYLEALGMPADRIVLGYNAVDHDAWAERADAARREAASRTGLPSRPYFLAINRFVPEKNLEALVRAYATYRRESVSPWELVLCGDGPSRAGVAAEAARCGLGGDVHLPGFLQEDALVPWLAHAGGFVHPSRMEPWGLVVNEAAACALPLLVSDRAGCVETLVPAQGPPAGRRFDPGCEASMAASLRWLASLGEAERKAVGLRAREVAAGWGPARFASGAIEALERAEQVCRPRAAVGGGHGR
jgi:glycosyltransferase involved in cell wall biosynthesis